MKEGGATDPGVLPLQGVAAGSKGVFEGSERGKVRIDQRIIGELPEVFSGLELGGVGRQEDEMEALRDLEQRTDVIPGLVEHEHDTLGRTRAHGTGKRLQRHAHDRGVDGRGELPLAAPRGRMHKGEQIEPLEAVLHPGEGPLSATRPDWAQERLEPESMLVAGPDLKVSGWIGCLYLRYLLAESVCTKAA